MYAEIPACHARACALCHALSVSSAQDLITGIVSTLETVSDALNPLPHLDSHLPGVWGGPHPDLLGPIAGQTENENSVCSGLSVLGCPTPAPALAWAWGHGHTGTALAGTVARAYRFLTKGVLVGGGLPEISGRPPCFGGGSRSS